MGAYTNAINEMFETRLREFIEDVPHCVDVADHLRRAAKEWEAKGSDTNETKPHNTFPAGSKPWMVIEDAWASRNETADHSA
jgi:hypothetical protein